MSERFVPHGALRLFQTLRIPRKLGLGELIWSQALARHGIAWVVFNDFEWKLNLANDTHRWLVYGEYEDPGVRRLLERILRPGCVIVDSGANIGQMIVLYLRAMPSAIVHAFEPTAEARQWLSDCLTRNGLANVIVSPLALGDCNGWSGFRQYDFTAKEGAQNQLNESTESIPVEVITLDEYARTRAIQAIRFWKLDVEGHELPALRGSRELLERGLIDFLYVETSAAGAPIADQLAAFGYVAVPFGLNRVLTKDEVAAKFCNVFISPRVARDECGLGG